MTVSHFSLHLSRLSCKERYQWWSGL